MKRNLAAAYTQNRYAVHGAHPVEVTVMMLDRTIEHLNTIRYSIEKNGEPSVRASAFSRASALITEGLMVSLDPNNAIADDLQALYEYVLRTLGEGNKNNDIEKINECTKLLSEMKETWDILVKQYITQQAPKSA